MAVTASVIDNGLSRAGAFFDHDADWTIAGWFKCSQPSTSYCTFFTHGDPDFVGSYIWFGVYDDGIIYVDAFDGTTSKTAFAPFNYDEWTYIVATYKASTTTLSLYIGTALADTVSANLAGYTFSVTDQMMLTDTSTLAQAGVTAAQFRMWQKVLTSGQMLAEKVSATAVHATNLLCDTPLPNAFDLLDATANNEDWSVVGAITSAASPALDTVRYSGAIGISSSLGRSNLDEPNGVLHIRKGNALLLKLMCHWETPPVLTPAPGNPLCDLSQYYLQYRANGSLITTVPFVGPTPDRDFMPYGWPTQYVEHWPGPSDPLEVINCVLNQTLEMRFKLGTYDPGTGLHDADGYIEIRINGVVELLIDNIALGINDVDGWDGIRIRPSGSIDGTGANGGMTAAYVNSRDVYGAGNYPLIDLDASTETDADLWVDLGGPWGRFTQLGVAVTSGQPEKEGTRIGGNGEYMSMGVAPSSIVEDEDFEPAATPTTPTPSILEQSSTPCCGDDTGAGATPTVEPVESPVWERQCETGGNVPTAADPVLTELWDF